MLLRLAVAAAAVALAAAAAAPSACASPASSAPLHEFQRRGSPPSAKWTLRQRDSAPGGVAAGALPTPSRHSIHSTACRWYGRSVGRSAGRAGSDADGRGGLSETNLRSRSYTSSASSSWSGGLSASPRPSSPPSSSSIRSAAATAAKRAWRALAVFRRGGGASSGSEQCVRASGSRSRTRNAERLDECSICAIPDCASTSSAAEGREEGGPW
mmetsp:Transcript_19066/g.64280  ORF Transcript_19066/g.64280 Transcript_19066/m.64280 type:complete len:213 (+) Transcript_19066:2-640(+)